MADYAIHDTTLTGISNVIRKKEGSSALIDPAEYADRINYMGMLEKKIIVSSPICDFSDGSDDVPTDFVKISIPANLDGKSSVSEKQTGRNLLSGEDGDIPKTKNGVIFSVSNGIYTVEATETKTGYPYAQMAKFDLKKGTYTISLENVITGLQLRVVNRNVSPVQTLATTGSNTSATFTLSDDVSDLYFEIAITASSMSEGTYIIKPQLEFGSTAHSYEPYIEPKTYSANLGRTIYGGEVDIVNGTVKTPNMADFASNINSSSYGCDIESFNDGSIRFHGTPTASYLNLTSWFNFSIQAGETFTLSDTIAKPYRIYIAVRFDDNTTANVIIERNTTSITYTTEKNIIQIRLDTAGLTANTAYDETIYVQLEKGSSVSPYSPYFEPFTFDGQEIPTRLGYNAFYSEDGDTSVAYRSSGTIYQYPRGEEASF